jgi:2-iminobutanoate/2-iminopropanoate deaminase
MGCTEAQRPLEPFSRVSRATHLPDAQNSNSTNQRLGAWNFEVWSLVFGGFLCPFASLRLCVKNPPMAKREIKHPDKEKSTGAYSSAVEIDGWVYVSGQGPVDSKTAQPMRGSIEDETLYTLNQVKKILEAAGCTLNDVVKSTVHLADMEDFDRYNKVYKEFFKDVTILPARTTVQSVLWNAIKVEIDVVARKSGG